MIKHITFKDGVKIIQECGMDMYTPLYLKWITNKNLQLCMAQETLLNILWQPGWEGSLGENGYRYIYI